MYVTSNFQIKILPEYWNVFWYMLQAVSLGCRLGWSLVLGCVSGIPLGSTLLNQGGQNRMGQRNTDQMTLADHTGVWSDDGSPGLSWLVHWPGCHTSPGWAVHIGCSRRGCWFTLANWQHFQQLDSESLKGGQDSTSPCSPHSMYYSCRGRWWGCTVGETLDDWYVSQYGDLVILLNTLLYKNQRRMNILILQGQPSCHLF